MKDMTDKQISTYCAAVLRLVIKRFGRFDPCDETAISARLMGKTLRILDLLEVPLPPDLK